MAASYMTCSKLYPLHLWQKLHTWLDSSNYYCSHNKAKTRCITTVTTCTEYVLLTVSQASPSRTLVSNNSFSLFKMFFTFTVFLFSKLSVFVDSSKMKYQIALMVNCPIEISCLVIYIFLNFRLHWDSVITGSQPSEDLLLI